MMDQKTLAKYLDSTLLKPEATPDQIKALCAEAAALEVAAVCVNTAYIPLIVSELAGSGVKPCATIGFPLGACATEIKAAETAYAIANGAQEVDMVIAVGAVKDKDWDYVRKDIEAVAAQAKGKALLKVIIEACLLTDEEKEHVCRIAKEAGADYVKTSTGFSTGGATVADIALMRKTVGPDMGVKAAGGIRTNEDALAMIEAGATRIGTSSAAKILGV